MSSANDTLSAEDYGQVSNLQLLARQVVEGLCAGMHRSPHKGFSVEFKQHRQYVAGDELRHLDWKVFGKSDRLYIREYEEETTLRAHILLDCSGSMSYQGESDDTLGSKHHYATRLSACLAYLMMQQQDSVGLITFDDQIRSVVPPRSKPSHLKTLLEEMEQSRPGGESELGRVFRSIAPKLGQRSLLIVISDCFCNTEELFKALSCLRHGRHEIVIFQIWDRDEIEFPFREWTRFENLEIADHFQMVDPAHLRSAYLKNLGQFRDEITSGCSQRRIDLAPMMTDQPYSEALAEYLALRSRKRR